MASDSDDRKPDPSAAAYGGRMVLPIDHTRSRAELQTLIRDALARVRDEGMRSILVDMRLKETAVSAEDRLILANFVSSVWPKELPIAVLLPPELLTPDRLFEFAATNRGVLVRMFIDLDEAHAWLDLRGDIVHGKL